MDVLPPLGECGEEARVVDRFGIVGLSFALLSGFALLFGAVGFFQLQHGFFGLGRIGRYTAQNVIPHRNGSLERSLLAIV